MEEDLINKHEDLNLREKYTELLNKIYILKQKERSKGIMEQFCNIEEFINNMSSEDIEYIYEKMDIVSTDPILKNSGIPSSTLEPLGVYYLVAFKNFDFVREIDDSLLFYTINSLRCIPFEQYETVLRTLTNKILTEILLNDDIKYNKNKDTDERRIIMIKIKEQLRNNPLDFNTENLDSTMDNVIKNIVLPRIEKIVDRNTFDFDSILTNKERHR